MSAPAPIIIPAGLTVNIGRKEFLEGMELPADAPESVKKLVNDKIADLAKKKKEPVSLDTTVTISTPQEGGKK
jgi:hypothetical protein